MHVSTQLGTMRTSMHLQRPGLETSISSWWWQPRLSGCRFPNYGTFQWWTGRTTPSWPKDCSQIPKSWMIWRMKLKRPLKIQLPEFLFQGPQFHRFLGPNQMLDHPQRLQPGWRPRPWTCVMGLGQQIQFLHHAVRFRSHKWIPKQTKHSRTHVWENLSIHGNSRFHIYIYI